MKKILIDEVKDYYYADEEGNIYSYYNNKEKKLSYDKDKDGYFRVSLQTNKGRKNYRINRIIAMTFIENKDNLPVVHHKDNNKENNSVTNLEWTSIKENTIEGYKNKNYHFTKKIKAIFPCGKVLIFNSIKECANYFDISFYDISKIANNKIAPRKRGKIANIIFQFV